MPSSQLTQGTRGLTRIDWAALGPGIVALGALVVLAIRDGGFPATSWYVASLYLLAVLGVVVLSSRGRVLALSWPTMVAIGLLAAFTVWSFASISWAGVKGDAWDGANRTLLYLIVFVLFTLLPWRATSGIALLAVFVLATTALGVFDLIRAGVVSNPQPYFVGSRFASPTGYQNANAALFMTPVWPALFLAARRELPPLVRGLMLASAGLLVDLAYLGQSRGWLYAVPVTILLYLAVVPRRLRSLIALGLAGAATGLALSRLNGVYNATGATELRTAMRYLWVPLAAICGALFLVGVAWGVVDRFVRVPQRTEIAVGRAVAIVTAVGVVTVLVLSFARWDATGHLRHSWHQFAEQGSHPNKAAKSHFASGLGGGRYDYWRVAVKEFKSRPIGGVGADNFALGYLQYRTTTEEPLYPHSVELRILAGTGIVGAILFVGFLAAVVAAVVPVWKRRRQDPLTWAVAAGAIVTFGYWWIHGSVDWFWEFPALGGPTFAWLGLVAALGGGRPERATTTASSVAWARLRLVAGIALTAFAVASFVPPLLAARDVETATQTWRADPQAALSRLRRAREINFLSDQPDLVAGAIASRIRDWPEMRRRFSAAIDRNPRNWYPYLELGVLDAIQGDRSGALRLLSRAQALDPIEETTRTAIRTIRRGGTLSLAELDRLFVERVNRVVQ